MIQKQDRESHVYGIAPEFSAIGTFLKTGKENFDEKG
jgi:hypothetical protein